MEKEKRKTIALYARVSSTEQAERELPIAGQLEALRAYFTRLGWTVVAEYIDAGRSAFSRIERRTEFARLVADARAGKFSAVGVWKLDRFARNLREGLNFAYDLIRAGVELISITESGIDSSPSGTLTRSMLLACAEFFSQQQSQNIRRGLTASFARGKWVHNSAPYGYRIQRDNGSTRIVPDEKEAPVVRLAYSLAAHGYGLKATIHELARRGIRTREGCEWNTRSLHRIMRSDVYLGRYACKLGRREHDHEAIVDQRVWQRAQEVGAVHRNKWCHPRMLRSPYLLSLWTRCGVCGQRVRGIAHKRQYYACSTRITHGHDACQCKPVRKDWLETHIIWRLRKLFLHPDELITYAERLAHVARSSVSTRQIHSDTSVLVVLRRRQANILNAIEHVGIDQRLEARLTEITGRISAIEISLGRAHPRHPGRPPTLRSQVSAGLAALTERLHAPFWSLRPVLKEVIDKILVYSDRIEIFVMLPRSQSDSESPLPALGPFQVTIQREVPQKR